MISILIPVYNCDVNELVQSLSDQIASSKIKCEIIIIDDASDASFRHVNLKSTSLPLVTYHQLHQNIGRNRIRQKLAETAKQEWLLFLDGDSKITDENFVPRYLQQITSFTDVIIGGRRYQELPPSECRLRLHWKYGTFRESAYYAKNGGLEYFGFISNNFLIRREIFFQLSFAENLKGYGHEDTWIGIQLEKLHAKMTFISNPVLHDGLEDIDQFLEKSRSAVENLNVLSRIIPPEVLKKHVKLFRYYLSLRKLGVTALVSMVGAVMEPYIMKNVHSCNPSLFFYDLYRLSYLISLRKQKT